MKYEVGDKVRVRGDLEVGKQYGNDVFVDEMEEYKGKVAKVEKEMCSKYRLGNFRYRWTSEMLRPAEFKIWCETEEEKQAVLEELEREGYVWCYSGEKPTEWNGINDAPMGLMVKCGELYQEINDIVHDRNDLPELTPSEFTGIDFSEKIIIAKTPTGAIAIYGDKTVTTEGDFEDASIQAFAEILCPFKLGDKVRYKLKPDCVGEVTKISANLEVQYSSKEWDAWHYFNELEPYTEPYNAKLFCVKGSNLSANDYFEKGCIYEVKNGRILGYECTGDYKDIEHVNNALVAQFMEVKGGLLDE